MLYIDCSKTMEVDRDNSILAQEKRAIVSRSRRKATRFISADWQDGHRDISFSLKRRWQVMFWFSVWTIVCRTCQFTRVKYCHRNDFQKSHENHHIWRMQQMAMWFRFAKRMISVHEKLSFSKWQCQRFLLHVQDLQRWTCQYQQGKCYKHVRNIFQLYVWFFRLSGALFCLFSLILPFTF